MVKSSRKGNVLEVCFEGEIDHCAANMLRSEIETLLGDTRIQHLMLDFSGVTFMDSSGIGMIIGRYKTMMQRNGKVTAHRLQPAAERLFRMAGLHRIIKIEPEKGREDT